MRLYNDDTLLFDTDRTEYWVSPSFSLWGGFVRHTPRTRKVTRHAWKEGGWSEWSLLRLGSITTRGARRIPAEVAAEMEARAKRERRPIIWTPEGLNPREDTFEVRNSPAIRWEIS
jgi:hypothetical protein